MRKIGIVTIGQSPREDAAATLRSHLTQEAEILQRGALDDLDASAIAALAPEPGKPGLVTKTRDGTEVQVTHDKIVAPMQKAVDALVTEGAELIVLWCTGDFPELRAQRTILRPGKLLRGVITALVNGGKVGVVVPSASQTCLVARQLAGLDTVATYASPYAPPEIRTREWQRAAEELKDGGVDLVYLDCMGMEEDLKGIVQEVTQKPVILACSIVARVVDELLGQG